MTSGIGSLHKILKDDTRRRIILLLNENGSLAYMDLMKALGITNTGKMNYHLKVLRDLLVKNADGQYVLSEKGVLASRLLLEFSDPNVSQLNGSSKEPQVFWWGVIICCFASIGLSILARLVSGPFIEDFVITTTPFFFLTAAFLAIGSYMIYSDVRRNVKSNHGQDGFTKTKAAFLLFLVLLGIAFLLVMGAAAGVFTFVAAILVFLGFERSTFDARKSGIFWWGLVVFGLAFSWLFARLWWRLVASPQNFTFSAGLAEDIAEIFASLFFLFVGFQIMRRGAMGEGQTHSFRIESKLRKLTFYLSQRNYRALVYLFASVIVIFWAIVQPVSVPAYYLAYGLNFVGFTLLLLFYGKPSMYGGWYDPSSIVPYAILVFGLFVEIFIACEFLIALERVAPRIRKSEPTNSSAKDTSNTLVRGVHPFTFFNVHGYLNPNVPLASFLICNYKRKLWMKKRLKEGSCESVRNLSV